MQDLETLFSVIKSAYLKLDSWNQTLINWNSTWLKSLNFMIKKKSGLIHISALTDALSKGDKIVLTKIQLIMIRSFVKKNQEGYVNYRKEAMFLGELIKKLFNPSVLKKQAQLIERGEVKSDELMGGWTDQTLKKALNDAFAKYQGSATGTLSKDLWYKCLKESDLNLTDDELLETIENTNTIKSNVVNIKEFEDEFYTILRMIRTGKALYQLSDLS